MFIRSRRYNTVKAVEDLNKTIEDLKRALPGYNFTTVQDQGKYIEGSINEVMNTALIGILLAVFVLFIFLTQDRHNYYCEYCHPNFNCGNF